MTLASSKKENEGKIYFLQLKENGIFFPVLPILKETIKVIGLPIGAILATSFSLLLNNNSDDIMKIILSVFFVIAIFGFFIFLFVMFQNFAYSYKVLLKEIESGKLYENQPRFRELIEDSQRDGTEGVLLADITLQFFYLVNKKVNEKSEKKDFTTLFLIFNLAVLIVLKIIEIMNR